VSGSHPAPSTGDRQKDAGHFADEVRLLLRCQRQVAVAQLPGGQGREDPAPDAEIDCAHMGSLFSALHGQRYPSKIIRRHDPPSCSIPAPSFITIN
jgi:hypothetical protein